MASYHLSVKSISRSSGRSAVAAAAYRSGERLFDARQGMEHDYTRKGGVEHTELVAPEDAPDWVQNRDRLWNEVEANENRKNSVVAREWEVALPSELGDAARRALAVEFARTLVDRYGVVADVAVHAPHREGDDRNHHAHILTTTREIGSEGFGAKTRLLDVKQTASVEVSAMREHWAQRQNEALERGDVEDRVDHRTLEAQRLEVEAERDRLARDLRDKGREQSSVLAGSTIRQQRILDKAGLGNGPGEAQKDREWSDMEHRLARKTLEAVALDRAPEVKLGPAANAMERNAAREAEAQGRSYTPVTEAGLQVYQARERRSAFREAIERLGVLRDRMADAVRDAATWMRTGEWPKDRPDREKAVPEPQKSTSVDKPPERSGAERFAQRIYDRIEAERRADLENGITAPGPDPKSDESPEPERVRNTGDGQGRVAPSEHSIGEPHTIEDAMKVLETHARFQSSHARGDEEAVKPSLQAVRRSIMAIYKKSRENVERALDEARKTEIEISLASIMSSYDAFLTPENRIELGRGIERDDMNNVDLSDLDPARQRFITDREAAAAPPDAQTVKALQRLERADKDVVDYVASKGLDGDLILQRICDAPKVDRQTRDNWAARDIQALARSSNVSEKDAQALYKRALSDASRIYAKARDDIRAIKLEPERKQSDQDRDKVIHRRRDDDRGFDR